MPQHDYVLWKQHHLCELKALVSNELTKPTVFTPTHPIFTEIRQNMYGQGKAKTMIPEYMAAELDEFGLLVWYFDDGYWGTETYGYPRIANKGIDATSLEKAVSIVNSKLNLTLRVRSSKHLDSTTRAIKIPKQDKLRLLPIWMNFVAKYEIPNCMAYKLGMDGTWTDAWKAQMNMEAHANSVYERLRDPDWLLTEYETKQRSVLSIAQELGCSHKHVTNHMKKFGMKIRPRWPTLAP